MLLLAFVAARRCVVCTVYERIHPVCCNRKIAQRTNYSRRRQKRNKTKKKSHTKNVPCNFISRYNGPLVLRTFGAQYGTPNGTLIHKHSEFIHFFFSGGCLLPHTPNECTLYAFTVFNIVLLDCKLPRRSRVHAVRNECNRTTAAAH